MAPPDRPTLPPESNAGDQATLPPELAGPVVAPTPAVAPGFETLGELGRGGMGVVYRARQVRLNRTVALKVMLGGGHADSTERVRFLAEAEAVAAVDHPHVVRVYEFGQHADRPYLALEFCPGGSLAGRLKDNGALSPVAAAATVEKIARGVQAAHDQGIVHRDLKPGNVLLDAAGEPKVTDFGLAKRGAGADLTRTGAIMGTPAYMAPEQAAGEGKSAGPAADIYALGVVLFECLTGRPPFVSDDAIGLLIKVAAEDAPSARSLSVGVPADLDLICRKCLAKGPRDRYPTAAALADDLGRFARGEPVSVRPPTLGVVLRGWARQNVGRLGWAVAVGLLVGLLVGLFFWVMEISPRLARWNEAYALLPSAPRPAVGRAAGAWPEWAKRLLGLTVIAGAGGLGLFTARLARTKSRDADIVAGLLAGVTTAGVCFATGFGPAMILVSLDGAEDDLDRQAWMAWQEGPRDGVRETQGMLDRYPDLRRLRPEQRSWAMLRVQRSRLEAAVPIGLWVGLAGAAGLFIPFGVASTVTAGRVLRSGAGRGRVLAAYFEWSAPLMILVGFAVANLSQLALTGLDPRIDWREFGIRVGCTLGTTGLALIAVQRGWPVWVRLPLHGAWLFFVFYW